MRKRTVSTRSQLGNVRTSTERYGPINLYTELHGTGVVVMHAVGYIAPTIEQFAALLSV